MTFKLCVPYLWVKAPSNVTVIIDSGAGGSSGVSGGSGGGGGTAAPITTRDGLGDVAFSMAYKLLDDSRMPVGLDVGGKIKFGTADTSKGLGTGKNDYNLYTEIYRVWDNKLDTFVNLGYR